MRDAAGVDLSVRHHLSVCPHDTAKNLVGWFLFNNYLQTRLQARIQFAPQENILAERASVLAAEPYVVYANPYSALVFAQERGYLPVARPAGLFDETVLVCRADSGPAAWGPTPRVASATDKLIVHGQGLRLLELAGVDAGRAEFHYVGNHLNAAKAVIKGEAALGFVFGETWDAMSDTARSELSAVARSAPGGASHVFMVSPAWSHRASELSELLCAMRADPRGQEVLAELRFTAGFEPVPSHFLEQMGELAKL